MTSKCERDDIFERFIRRCICVGAGIIVCSIMLNMNFQKRGLLFRQSSFFVHLHLKLSKKM